MHSQKDPRLTTLPFAKLLRMMAAAWGTNYSAKRTACGEFVMVWERKEDGLLRLLDAVEVGQVSFQVEGLMVKYLLLHNAAIKAEEVGSLVTKEKAHAETEAAEYRGTGELVFSIIKRSDWRSDMATPADWEELRAGLYATFYEGGRGFYAHDLQFADRSIDWLKSGKPVTAGACSSLSISPRRSTATPVRCK